MRHDWLVVNCSGETRTVRGARCSPWISMGSPSLNLNDSDGKGGLFLALWDRTTPLPHLDL